MGVTVKDIASRLGVSYSTVAYALSGKGTIKEETRLEVRRCAEELGYVPNLYAREFRRKRTRICGVIVPNFGGGYSEIVEEVYIAATDKGWDVQAGLTEFDIEAESRQVRRFMELRADLVVLRSGCEFWRDVPAGHGLRLAEAAGVPVLVLGADLRECPFLRLAPDYPALAELVMEHLCRCGARNIAFAAGVSPVLYRTNAEIFSALAASFSGRFSRRAQFRLVAGEDAPAQPSAPQAVQATGGRLSSSLLQAGRELLCRALAMPEPPDTLVFRSDVLAIGALHQARDMGMRIPQDMQVLALTRNYASEFSPLALTSVDFPPAEVAQQILRLARGGVCGRSGRRVVPLRPVLIERATTAGGGRS